MRLTRTAAAVSLMCACAALSACGGFREDRTSQDVDATVAAVEQKAKESQTIGNLAKINDAIGAYVKDTRRIPENLDLLVPKYLAEIPTVELGLRGYRDKAKVTIYPPTVLRDGQVDGMLIKDTGGWGYVYNDRQVVVFVDCTHKNAAGRAWYLERGL